MNPPLELLEYSIDQPYAVFMVVSIVVVTISVFSMIVLGMKLMDTMHKRHSETIEALRQDIRETRGIIMSYDEREENRNTILTQSIKQIVDAHQITNQAIVDTQKEIATTLSNISKKIDNIETSQTREEKTVEALLNSQNSHLQKIFEQQGAQAELHRQQFTNLLEQAEKNFNTVMTGFISQMKTILQERNNDRTNSANSDSII